MTLTAALLGFAPLAALLTILPGPDLTLVLRAAVVNGPRAAMVTATGICLGGLLWGFAAAVGVAAVLHAVPLAFRALSYVGAAYLAWLGFQLLRAPVGQHDGRPVAARLRAAFAQGLTTNLLNPKVGVFYVSVIPQFPVPGVSPAIVGTSLAAVHAAMSVLLFGAVAASAGRLGVLLGRPRVARASTWCAACACWGSPPSSPSRRDRWRPLMTKVSIHWRAGRFEGNGHTWPRRCRVRGREGTDTCSHVPPTPPGGPQGCPWSRGSSPSV